MMPYTTEDGVPLTPHASTLLSQEDLDLMAALIRFMPTSACPTYLKTKGTAWVKANKG